MPLMRLNETAALVVWRLVFAPGLLLAAAHRRIAAAQRARRAQVRAERAGKDREAGS
jgi:hypothetical protein